ncbi:predicted protein [Nematostella vectensis]|uniref:UspA domain-containing protein n=1 Tax=Nematostella vectensis TaxID=45351 RepID=A7S1B4_NEMVE|nr:universal stress protein YxiE isoform X1 [Nematostella vectensis]XP_048579811.1 universal stress protein YxiE isoform X2 [Nematostella vectensis]EDO42428.1 predicted protein [Nematostella vectensis]|eukprot:XP_001634491.1 predicted protein [Nematostella vectensis]
MSRKVLVAVDGSEHSHAALDWYLKKCKRDDDMLYGCIVKQQPSLPTFSFKAGITVPHEEWEEILKKTNERANKEEEYFEMTVVPTKMKHEFEPLLDPDNKPGERICEHARNKKVDLIIMGTRGLNTLRRTLLGSVSDYVLHHAHVPIAIVPMPEEAK